jgi:hypothetical protein
MEVCMSFNNFAKRVFFGLVFFGSMLAFGLDCYCQTPTPTPPPIIFKVNATLKSNAAVSGGNPPVINVQGYSNVDVAGAITNPLPTWNLNLQNANYGGTNVGGAGINSISVSQSAYVDYPQPLPGGQTRVSTGTASDNDLTRIEVFVKGGAGTIYNLSASTSGNAQVTFTGEGNFDGSAAFSAPFNFGNNGQVGVSNLQPPYAAEMSYVDPPIIGGVCNGPRIQYQNTTYCRIGSYSVNATAGFRNSGTFPNDRSLSASSNGSFNVSAEIAQGVPPISLIRGPIFDGQEVSDIPVGGAVFFDSLSYDPDNNQGTTVGAGIIEWEWTVENPNGIISKYPSSAIGFSANIEGLYKVTLKVIDDEGMSASTTKSFNTRYPNIQVSETELNFGAVAKGQRLAKSFTVTNTGPNGGSLNVSIGNTVSPFEVVGVTNFSLNGGESKVVSIDFAPTTIRMFKNTIAVNSNDIDTPSIGVVLKAATKATFKFWIKAFIPKDIPDYTTYLPSPPSPNVDWTFIPSPDVLVTGYWYKTDQRTFDNSVGASARLTLIGSYHVVGYDQLSGGTLGIDSDPTLACWNLPLEVGYCFGAKGRPRGAFEPPTRVVERVFNAKIYADAQNPLVPIGSINLKGSLTLNFASGIASSALYIEEFPSFEMYLFIDDETKTQQTQSMFRESAIPPVTRIIGPPIRSAGGLLSF